MMILSFNNKNFHQINNNYCTIQIDEAELFSVSPNSLFHPFFVVSNGLWPVNLKGEPKWDDELGKNVFTRQLKRWIPI